MPKGEIYMYHFPLKFLNILHYGTFRRMKLTYIDGKKYFRGYILKFKLEF